MADSGDWADGPAPANTEPYRAEAGERRNGGDRRSPSPRRERTRSPPRGGGDRYENRGRGGGGGGGGGGVNPGNNLHVSGISNRCEDNDLEELFGKHGKVAKAQVMKDPQTREVRGFGFVTMETAEDADACIAALNAMEFLGKVLNVEKARRGRARTPTPGQYHGPPKRDERRDDRYGGGGGGRDRYDDRRGGGYDDRYGGGRREDRDRYDRGYDRGYDRAAPMRDDRRRDDRGSGGGGRDRYDDRRY